MSCYHPSYIVKSIRKGTGEITSKFIGKYKCDIMERELLSKEWSGHKAMFGGDLYDDDKYYHQYIRIPCGKCIGCRIDYSRSWADRMTYHVFGKEDVSWFLTLTYNDDRIEDLSCDNDYNVYSLNYDHVRKFIQDLRNSFRDCDIDYYYSGEYGDASFRPHYHMILYNVPLKDLKFWKLNDNGDPIYTSDTVSDLWPFGFATVSHFSWHGAAYCAQYVEKKRDGRLAAEYDALNISREKCFMSRRPGIAHDYYVQNYSDLWKNEGLSVDRLVHSSGHLGIPRYFRKLAVDNQIGFEEFCEYERKCLEKQNTLNPLKLENSSFDDKKVRDMLAFEEREVLKSYRNKKL